MIIHEQFYATMAGAGSTTVAIVAGLVASRYLDLESRASVSDEQIRLAQKETEALEREAAADAFQEWHANLDRVCVDEYFIARLVEAVAIPAKTQPLNAVQLARKSAASIAEQIMPKLANGRLAVEGEIMEARSVLASRLEAHADYVAASVLREPEVKAATMASLVAQIDQNLVPDSFGEFLAKAGRSITDPQTRMNIAKRPLAERRLAYEVRDRAVNSRNAVERAAHRVNTLEEARTPHPGAQVAKELWLLALSFALTTFVPLLCLVPAPWTWLETGASPAIPAGTFLLGLGFLAWRIWTNLVRGPSRS